MSLKSRVESAKEEFWLDNREAPEVIIVRPEIKMELIMIQYGVKSFEEAIMLDLNYFLDMQVAVSDDSEFPDFKLAKF